MTEMVGRRFRFGKIILIVIAILLALVAIGLVFVYSTLRASLPKTDGTIEIEGIEDTVTIYNDELGRPHIYASNINDLFFGQGFAHAQDRLWQMELHRRAGEGRISEVIGRSELDTDILLRTAGLPRVGQLLMSNSTPTTVSILGSYAEGVNAYLDSMNRVPPEFILLGFEPEPWTVEQVFGVAALMAFDSANNYQNELFRLSLQQELLEPLYQELIPPAYPDNDVPTVWTEEKAAIDIDGKELLGLFSRLDLTSSSYYPSLGLGSSGWCVAPGKSTSGNALFAFDSHDALGMPSLYYENRLVIKGELDLYGWSVPGMAAMIDGFNEYIAWGLTNIGDTQDLYLEERHPEDPHMFLYDDQWYEAEVITDSINVSGQDDPEEIEIIITRNGPLISEEPAISLAWTALHSDEGFDALLDVNLAENWDEFRTAANKFTMPSTNFTYADIEGNIASRTVGLLPIRSQGIGVVPMPGWDSAYAWEGFIPMDEMPEVFNPADEYVAAANALIAREDYPYILSVDNAPGYRMRRIVQYLESENLLTLENMKELQTDWHNAHAEHRLPSLLTILEANQEHFNEQETAGVEILKEWADEPINARDEAGPAIFESFYLHLGRTIFAEEMGDELFENFLRRNYVVYEVVERLWDQGKGEWFRGNSLESLIITSYREAISELVGKLGDDPYSWRWDQLQTLHLRHDVGNELGPLSGFYNRGPFPMGGGHTTVGRAGYRLQNPFDVSHVSTIRVVAEMADSIEAYGVIPIGQSGHPLSKHYDDQIETWMAKEYYPIYHQEVPPKADTLILNPK